MMMRNTLPPLRSNELLCRAVRWRGFDSAEPDNMRAFANCESRSRNKRVVRYVRPIHQSKVCDKRFASDNARRPANERHAQVMFLRHVVNEQGLSLTWIANNDVRPILTVREISWQRLATTFGRRKKSNLRRDARLLHDW